MIKISYENHFVYTCSSISSNNKVCKLEMKISCKNAPEY